MKDYSVSLTNTDGSAFPNTKAVNASSPTATDGSEYVKVLIDDYWGANQALMRDAGLTPDGADELATASQRQEAIRFLIQNKVWNAYFNGTNWLYIAAGKAFRFVIDDANERVRFDSAIAGAADGVITWVNGPYIDANGFVGSIDQPYLQVQDQKSSGVVGGTFATGSYITRVLNTVVTNTVTGASLGSNQITLLEGTYYCEIFVPAYSASPHKAKLYNITDAADEIIGTPERDNVGVQTNSKVIGLFTIAATKIFEIRHICTASGGGTSGLGFPGSFGDIEIYTTAQIWKLR